MYTSYDKKTKTMIVSSLELDTLPNGIFNQTKVEGQEEKDLFHSHSPNENTTQLIIKRLHINMPNLESFPEEVCDLSLLEGLTISSSKLTNIPNSISKLKLLRDLSISNNCIKSIPETISQCKSLIYVYINNHKKYIPSGDFNNLEMAKSFEETEKVDVHTRNDTLVFENTFIAKYSRLETGNIA